MTRDMRLYFEDILDSITKIEQYTQAIDEREFLANTQIQDAVFRRFEIIGEAVKNIPPPFRDKYPHIPWKKIAGLRDVLIHEYFGVNLDLVWEAVEGHLPGLMRTVEAILRELEESA